MTFPLRISDVVDISIIAFIAYHVINLIRGTRTAQMLIGFLIVLATYLASQYFELNTLNWVLSNFLASIILVVVVIFQNDIRRALTQVGARRSFSAGSESPRGRCSRRSCARPCSWRARGSGPSSCSSGM